MNPVRILVVGVGQWGRTHARTIAGIAEAELTGVVDPSERSISLLRQDLPNVRAWQELDLALDQSQPDACIIATRTADHVAVAKNLLRRGLPVLIEKPLAFDEAAAEPLESLVAGGSANLMMGHVVLFAPEFRQLLRETKRRGRPHYFHAVRHRPQELLRIFTEEDPIRMTMVHDFYMAVALMESESPQHITGRVRRRRDGRIDLAEVHMEWRKQTFGSFTASFITPPGMSADGFDRFEVFGDGWAGRMQLNPQPLEIFDQSVHWPMTLAIEDTSESPAGWLAEQDRHFCRVVRGQAQVPVGARYEDARIIQSWMDQLYAAVNGATTDDDV